MLYLSKEIAKNLLLISVNLYLNASFKVGQLLIILAAAGIDHLCAYDGFFCSPHPRPVASLYGKPAANLNHFGE